jgi:hypothetical protein
MKGKTEADCHNYVRVVTPLRNGRLLVCGTHVSFSNELSVIMQFFRLSLHYAANLSTYQVKIAMQKDKSLLVTAWLHMILITILPTSICQTQMKFLLALSAISAPTIRLSTVNDCLAVKALERKRTICELLKVSLIFKEQV